VQTKVKHSLFCLLLIFGSFDQNQPFDPIALVMLPFQMRDISTEGTRIGVYCLSIFS
jgi:hypothetical protein